MTDSLSEAQQTIWNLALYDIIYDIISSGPSGVDGRGVECSPGNQPGPQPWLLQIFWCIQWEREPYSRRTKAQCYRFNLAHHRFWEKNSQVLVTWYHTWYNIWYLAVCRTVGCYWCQTPTIRTKRNHSTSLLIWPEGGLPGVVWGSSTLFNCTFCPIGTKGAGYSASHKEVSRVHFKTFEPINLTMDSILVYTSTYWYRCICTDQWWCLAFILQEHVVDGIWQPLAVLSGSVSCSWVYWGSDATPSSFQTGAFMVWTHRYTCTYSYIQVCTSTYWYILLCTSMYQYILVFTSIYNFIQVLRGWGVCRTPL